MTSVSRRGFIHHGGALATAAIAAPALVGCAAMSDRPEVQTVAPGVTQVDLGGGVRVTTVSDGFATRPLDAGFVRNAPLAAVQATLAEQGLPTDALRIPFSALLVEVGTRRVVIDTGNGEFGPPSAGQLVANLARAGVEADSIDAVLISHFHGDHINGLRSKAGAPAFPNATVHVPAPEWAWWMDDRRMNAAPEAMRGAFAATRRVFNPIAASVQRFEPGDAVLAGIVALPAFGHTPGHTVFAIAGRRHRLMYWADVTNVAPLFVRHPDWAVVFDMDAEAARATRRRIADMVIADNMLLAGFHLPQPAIGRLARRGEGYDFAPLAAAG